MTWAYVVARKDAVDKLQRADGHEEGHEGVQQARALRRRVEVVRDHVAGDLVPGLDAAAVAGLGGDCRLLRDGDGGRWWCGSCRCWGGGCWGGGWWCWAGCRRCCLRGRGVSLRRHFEGFDGVWWWVSVWVAGGLVIGW